ncbi:hypothetical protein HYPSUDRAFT_252080 [Hypholoma sublateritium FD-334 SS-4]|uniref:FCP1 homology domain-containing protein n=1 Tax=Hypholoma sublateritium (strain FD-334 SS-4) TaxID=945553 RepID=A0A0D2QEK6_HYPSF|nr:hypothetical protein HYPSUDRAFT_252080 [Hypholoma sublateritium FD-334 SS-4]
MNTLGYVARQFDVLASPQPRDRTDPRLPRVNSWSTRSLFLAPHLRRTHSSPAIPAPVDAPPPPPPPLPDAPPRSKPHIESVIDQIFFIRVFLVVWDRLKSVWAALPWPTLLAIRADLKAKAADSAGDLVVGPAALPVSLLSLARALAPPRDSVLSSPAHARPASSPAARKTFLRPKTLVLDLDETLIHSTSRPIPFQASGSGILSLGSFGRRNQGAGHMVEVVLGGRSTLYHVYKRPFVDFFLRTVSGWYTLVIFTASMQEYADPVIDWLDAGRGILEHRFFRDSCTQLPNGSYTKDLSVIEADLSRVCLVDNSPVSYSVNEANGIPIEGWTHDPSDEALLDLLPVLDSLRFTSDVRRVLGLRSAGVHFMTTSSAIS